MVRERTIWCQAGSGSRRWGKAPHKGMAWDREANARYRIVTDLHLLFSIPALSAQLGVGCPRSHAHPMWVTCHMRPCRGSMEGQQKLARIASKGRLKASMCTHQVGKRPLSTPICYCKHFPRWAQAPHSRKDGRQVQG